MKQHLKYMNARSFLPVVIAGGFAIGLLIVLMVFVLRKDEPAPPSADELAADYAKGLQYERGDGVTLDYVKALEWYRKAGDAGYPPAELEIGIMTMTGHGVVQDPKAAVEWFRKAAEHGLAEAQVQFAGDLLSGVATADGKPDRIEAMKWLLIGAEKMPDPLTQTVAIHTREALAAQMAEADLGEARQRAKDWQKQHP